MKRRRWDEFLSELLNDDHSNGDVETMTSMTSMCVTYTCDICMSLLRKSICGKLILRLNNSKLTIKRSHISYLPIDTSRQYTGVLSLK